MNIVTYNGKYYLPTNELGIDRKYKFKVGETYYFEDAEYAELQKSPIIQDGLKAGFLKVITTKDAEKVSTKKTSTKKVEISALSLEDAKLLVASETKKTDLTAWLKEEKNNQMRPEVIAILEANLKTGMSL
jgi:superfamily I DNA/RNA helicase